MKSIKIKFFAILIHLAQVQSYADECTNFIDTVLKIPIPSEGMVSDGQQQKNDLGLYFYKYYDSKNNIIKIK